MKYFTEYVHITPHGIAHQLNTFGKMIWVTICHHGLPCDIIFLTMLTRKYLNNKHEQNKSPITPCGPNYNQQNYSHELEIKE